MTDNIINSKQNEANVNTDCVIRKRIRNCISMQHSGLNYSHISFIQFGLADSKLYIYYICYCARTLHSFTKIIISLFVFRQHFGEAQFAMV